jgi:hypothetical protein
MPRRLQRVRLESGLKLNLISLARRGFIKPGAITGPVGIAWTDDTAPSNAGSLAAYGPPRATSTPRHARSTTTHSAARSLQRV